MAKRKKKKKKSKKTKKTRRKKSKKIIRSKKKTRKVKKTKKSRSKKRKKSKSKSRKAKPRKFNFKAPKLLEDGDGKSLIKVSDSWANHAYVNESKYKKKYKLSIKENDKFWAKEGKRITWIKKYSKIKETKTISHLPLIKQSRLSVMPIDFKSWKIIYKMGKINPN